MFPVSNEKFRQQIEFVYEIVKIIFFSDNCPGIAPTIC